LKPPVHVDGYAIAVKRLCNRCQTPNATAGGCAVMHFDADIMVTKAAVALQLRQYIVLKLSVVFYQHLALATNSLNTDRSGICLVITQILP
jgi:hypothetical protein